MSERECTCDRPITRLRKKRKYCHECGGKLTLDSGDTPQQQRSSNILSRSAELIYENLQGAARGFTDRLTGAGSAPRYQNENNNPEITELSSRLRRSLVFEPQEVAANENIYEVPRDAREERAEEINEAREDLNDTVSLRQTPHIFELDQV